VSFSFVKDELWEIAMDKAKTKTTQAPITDEAEAGVGTSPGSMMDRVITKPMWVLKARLVRQVRLFERRYEMSSEDMLMALRNGAARETAEISKWMQSYLVLKRFGGILMAGTASRTTPSSTKND